MLPGVRKWFRDYGKGMRLGLYSGLLAASGAKYCLLDMKGDADAGNAAIVIGVGVFSGICLGEAIGSARDTYRMRKMEKRNFDSIQ